MMRSLGALLRLGVAMAVVAFVCLTLVRGLRIEVRTEVREPTSSRTATTMTDSGDRSVAGLQSTAAPHTPSRSVSVSVSPTKIAVISAPDVHAEVADVIPTDHDLETNDAPAVDADSSVATDPEVLAAWVTEPATSPRQVVSGRRFATVEEAEADTRSTLNEAVNEVLARRGLGSVDLRTFGDSVDSVVRRRAVEPITMRTEASEFVVYRVHYLADLSPESLSGVVAHAESVSAMQRLWKLGGLAAFLTMLFGTIAGYLRLDDATNGRYRVRLEFASVALVGAAGFLVMNVV